MDFIIIFLLITGFALNVISAIINKEEENTIYCDETEETEKTIKCEYCDTWQHLNDSGRCSNCNAKLKIKKEK